jgi:aminopeptidase-like protein
MIGKKIYHFANKLWPLNRSLTGSGVRETLRQISKHLPRIKIKSIKSGAKVFDWTIPKEWSVKEAYITTPSGRKICNFLKNKVKVRYYNNLKNILSAYDRDIKLKSLLK